jgi:hypothetical protein
LKPLIKHGNKGSKPLAFETIALSTIEIIGATESAERIAHELSKANLMRSGESVEEGEDEDEEVVVITPADLARNFNLDFCRSN